MQFQPALDAYVAGGGQGGDGKDGGDLASADAELARATQWAERCAFPLDNFLPLFHLARRRGLPMVALGVDRWVPVYHRGWGGGVWGGVGGWRVQVPATFGSGGV